MELLPGERLGVGAESGLQAAAELVAVPVMVVVVVEQVCDGGGGGTGSWLRGGRN